MEKKFEFNKEKTSPELPQKSTHIMPGVLHIVRIGDAGLHAGLIAQISTAASRNTSLGRVLVLLVVALVDGVAQLAVLGDAAAAKLTKRAS